MTSTDLARTTTTEIEQSPAGAINLFGGGNPTEVIAAAKETADALVDVVEQRGLYTTFESKDKRTGEIIVRKHIEVTAWTLLGSMLGVFPVVIWTKQLSNGWEARVEARTRAGEIVGAAEAECRFSEFNWKNKASHEVRSQAQTRAIRNALKGPLSFIVELAGYSPDDIGDRPVTTEQHRKLAMTIKGLEEQGILVPDGYDGWEDFSRQLAAQKYGVASRSELTVSEMSELIEELASYEAPI